MRKKRRIHNFILKFITGTMFILFMFSVAAFDSESILPAITGMVSLTWLLLFALANGYLGE